MIMDRLYKPKQGDLVYHYCPPEAFLEIVRSRTIWHSAYSVLNDSMEREWGFKIFTEIVESQKEKMERNFIDQIARIVKASYENSLAMISSYSLDGDVLGQWRAYTDDGHGFAIGFSASEMEMPAKPLRILYDRDAQIKELTGNLKHTYEYEKSISLCRGNGGPARPHIEPSFRWGISNECPCRRYRRKRGEIVAADGS